MSDPVIILDPGHGGRDSGALSPTGLKESERVLTIAKIAEDFLKPYPVIVRLTRTTDVFVELSTRAVFANELGATLFVSIHANSAESQASGFEVFTSPGHTLSDPLATDIFTEYLATSIFKGMKVRAEYGDGDPDKEAKFTVLTRTNMKSVLVECEFIHTDYGDRWFRNGSNIQAAGEAIAKGILKNLGIPLRTTTLPVVPPPEALPVTIEDSILKAHCEQVIRLAEQIIELHLTTSA